MKNTRRDVLKLGALGGVASALGLPAAALAEAAKAAGPDTGLDILVLGGTGFIGPHMVREALRRGHRVTLFNRGRTNSTLFPDLERITGDRGGDLDGIRDRRWDVVIDNSGYVPRHVEASARALAPNVSFYLFVSTLSVYADFTRPNDEDAPLATLEDETVEEVTNETYGALKALCEKRVTAEMGAERLSIVRPSFICGPGDHTDRFTYYPVRARQGGPMLWPGSPRNEMQIIDVRDLARFVVDAVERKTAGTFNLATAIGAYTFGDLLRDSEAVLDVDVEALWAGDEFLAEEDAGTLFPLYFPTSGEDAAVYGFSNRRAVEAGLDTRPVRETVRDLMAWWDTLSAERIANARFSMTAAREAELIEALQARQG